MFKTTFEAGIIEGKHWTGLHDDIERKSGFNFSHVETPKLQLDNVTRRQKHVWINDCH